MAPALALGTSLVACSEPRDVVVRVSIPGLDSAETPLAGVGLVALPYDRDSVLAAMEARAARPRPHTAELDSLFAAFRDPFATYSAAAIRSSGLRDSLAALKQRLDSLPRSAPEYQRLYERFGRLDDSLAAAEERTARARVVLDSARGRFVGPAQSLRVAVRQWEDSTYRGYDTAVATLARQSGREPLADTTDALGRAELRLEPGRWWIYARAWDPTDPNREWYWNVPVEDDTVRLSSETGRRIPRY